MNLIRCESGHFYDAERFSECPFCNQTRISTVVEGEDGEENLYTQPLTPPDITEPIPDPDIEEFSKTVGVYDDLGAEDIEPCLLYTSPSPRDP